MARFSQRVLYPAFSNSYSQQLAALRNAGATLLDLTLSNPTHTFADYPHELIHNAFAVINDYTYEPTPFGIESARKAVSEHYGERGFRIDPERIVLTASTSEAYAILFKLLCDPGDEVLIPSPSYPLFEYLAAAECVKTVAYRVNYDGAWYIDFQHLRSHLSPRTRAIVIVNPNNPTGNYLTHNERDELISIARKTQTPIISDEVFAEYAIAPRREITRTLTEVEEVLSFSLDGLSKVGGMPQLKLGWLVINGPQGEQSTARERLEILSDTYLSVNTPVQSALPLLLNVGKLFRQTIQRRIEANLQSLDRLLLSSAASRLQTDGGWSAIVRLPDFNDGHDQAAELLAEENVIVQPGYFYDLPESWIVISLLTEPQIFVQGISALCTFINRQVTPE